MAQAHRVRTLEAPWKTDEDANPAVKRPGYARFARKPPEGDYRDPRSRTARLHHVLFPVLTKTAN